MPLEIKKVSILSHILPFYVVAGCWLIFLFVEIVPTMKMLYSA